MDRSRSWWSTTDRFVKREKNSSKKDRVRSPERAEALEKWRQTLLLLISGHRMPARNGWRFSNWQEAMPLTNAIHLTAYASRTGDEGHSLGALDYIQKPSPLMNCARASTRPFPASWWRSDQQCRKRMIDVIDLTAPSKPRSG